MLHIYTLRYAAVWHCRLHDLDAVVFKEVVEITFPDSSSLDSVGVDRLREECVKMQNLQKREGVNLERSLQTPEVCNSNPVIGKFLSQTFIFCWKDEI